MNKGKAGKGLAGAAKAGRRAAGDGGGSAGTANADQRAGSSGSGGSAGSASNELRLESAAANAGRGSTGGSEETQDIARLRGRWMARVIAAVVLIVAVGALTERGGAAEWLFTVVAALAAGASLLPYAAIGSLRAERVIRNSDRLADGGEMQVEVTVQASRMLPFIWVCLQDEFVRAELPRHGGPPRGGMKAIRALLPGFRRRLTLTYTVKGVQRGELVFGNVKLAAGDLLGLCVRNMTVHCPGHAIIRPAPPSGEITGELPGFEAAPNRHGSAHVAAFGGQMSAAASRLGRDGAAPELRAYALGDSLRRVDWRAMARGLGMQTRTEETAEAGTVTIVLETSSAAYGQDRRLFDANAGRALAYAERALRQGKRIKLFTNATADGLLFDGDEPAGLREAAERLAKLRFGKEAVTSMSQRLSDVIAGASRGAYVLCLTAGVNADAMTARESDDPGNISYGAKLAGVRGIRLTLLLSVAEGYGAEVERGWQAGIGNASCIVKALAVPDRYLFAQPSVTAATAGFGTERSGLHVEIANG